MDHISEWGRGASREVLVEQMISFKGKKYGLHLLGRRVVKKNRKGRSYFLP